MEKIEQLVGEYAKTNPFSGIVTVAKQNQVIKRLEYGYRDFESKANFFDKQLFPIASITKQFIAVGILLHVEQHKLALDHTISHYLTPDHSLWQGNMPKWAKQITLHNLLTNSSGLPNYYLQAIMNPNEWLDINNVDVKDVYKTIINKIKDIPLDFVPGSKLVYNNINFLILGIILAEVVCDDDVGDFYRKEIFTPLGLKNTIWPSLEQELAYIHQQFPELH